MAPAEAHRLRALMIIHMDTSTGGLHFPPITKTMELLRLHFPEKVGGHGCLSHCLSCLSPSICGGESADSFGPFYLPNVSIWSAWCCQNFTGNRNVTVIPGLCCLVWGSWTHSGVWWLARLVGFVIRLSIRPFMRREQAEGQLLFWPFLPPALLFHLAAVLQSRNLLCRVIGSCWHWHKKCKFNKCLKSVAGATLGDSECFECSQSSGRWKACRAEGRFVLTGTGDPETDLRLWSSYQDITTGST